MRLSNPYSHPQLHISVFMVTVMWTLDVRKLPRFGIFSGSFNFPFVLSSSLAAFASPDRTQKKVKLHGRTTSVQKHFLISQNL